MSTSLKAGNLSAPARPRALLDTLPGAATGPAFIAAGWTVDGATSRAALSSGNARVMHAPARLVIEFTQPTGSTSRSVDHHAAEIPLAHAMPYCTSVQIALAVSRPSRTHGAPYRMVALAFASLGDLVVFLSSRPGQALLREIARFATGPAKAMILTDSTSMSG